MDPESFLGLEATHNPHRWTLPVTPSISTGGNFLFGGCALGAAIEAMQRTTGRPVVWATGQYLSYAKPPAILDIDVVVAVHGHQLTQARAIGHVADTEILTVNAALGHRDLEVSGQWATMPQVPPPDDCPSRTLRLPGVTTIMDRIDARLASARDLHELDGRPGSGRAALWARMKGVEQVDAAALAILGDYVPFGISQALGRIGGGNSLDNTLRVVQIVPTEWVLLDIRIDAIANGFGHGSVAQWASDGTLLAVASQSTIVRFWEGQLPDTSPAEARADTRGATRDDGRSDSTEPRAARHSAS